MGKLVFPNHDLEKIATSVGEMLQQEIGAAEPLTCERTDLGNVSRSAKMGEIVHAVLGGKRAAITLGNLHFKLEQPRHGDVWAQIGKQGIGSYAGPILYSLALNKAVEADVELVSEKGARFQGAPAAAAKLNGSADLVKRAEKLLRARWTVSSGTVSIEPFFKILPQPEGSLLLINTLPRSTNLGFGSTLDAKEVMALAGLLEATL
ncbi:MAG: hypothetical protein ABIQ44_16450 [Chloroflexia bacterium]